MLGRGPFSGAPGGGSGGGMAIGSAVGGAPTPSGILYVDASGNLGQGPWKFDGSGNLIASTDATNDIGASGATRPKNLFLSGNITMVGSITLGARTQLLDIAAPFIAACLRGQGSAGAALRGNRSGADTANGPDVFTDTLNTRTAGFIFAVMNNAARRLSVNYEGRAFITVPNSAPVDGDLQNNEITWYLIEGSNTLQARLKYSTGAAKSLTTALPVS